MSGKKKKDLDVLDEVVAATILQKADATFQPIIGNTYHLYKRADESSFISLVEPDLWTHVKLQYISDVVFTQNNSWEIITKEAD